MIAQSFPLVKQVNTDNSESLDQSSISELLRILLAQQIETIESQISSIAAEGHTRCIISYKITPSCIKEWLKSYLEFSPSVAIIDINNELQLYGRKNGSLGSNRIPRSQRDEFADHLKSSIQRYEQLIEKMADQNEDTQNTKQLLSVLRNQLEKHKQEKVARKKFDSIQNDSRIRGQYIINRMKALCEIFSFYTRNKAAAHPSRTFDDVKEEIAHMSLGSFIRMIRDFNFKTPSSLLKEEFLKCSSDKRSLELRSFEKVLSGLAITIHKKLLEKVQQTYRSLEEQYRTLKLKRQELDSSHSSIEKIQQSLDELKCQKNKCRVELSSLLNKSETTVVESFYAQMQLDDPEIYRKKMEKSFQETDKSKVKLESKIVLNKTLDPADPKYSIDDYVRDYGSVPHKSQKYEAISSKIKGMIIPKEKNMGLKPIIRRSTIRSNQFNYLQNLNQLLSIPFGSPTEMNASRPGRSVVRHFSQKNILQDFTEEKKLQNLHNSLKEKEEKKKKLKLYKQPNYSYFKLAEMKKQAKSSFLGMSDSLYELSPVSAKYTPRVSQHAKTKSINSKFSAILKMQDKKIHRGMEIVKKMKLQFIITS